MEQLFNAILEIARQNPDGFTVDLTTLKKVTKGISVAYLETQDSFGNEGLERVLNHALMHEKKVGGWFNEENQKFYFDRSEEHTSELQSRQYLVCRLLLEKKKKRK